jgi:lactate permease
VMLAVWTQRYEPVANNLALSALVAALPVIVLLGLLGMVRIKAHYAALAGLATAFLVALLVYGMPAPMATAALANGALFGLFPIGWIVLTAMFVYDLTVETGQFELVKDSIAGMASDASRSCWSRFVSAPSSRARPGSARRSRSVRPC